MKHLTKHRQRGLLTAILGLTLFAGAAHAQTINMGVVDEDKLADSYKKYKDAVDALDRRAQSLDDQIPSREFFNETEGKRFDLLILKADRNAAENTELSNLVKTGLDRRAKYTVLNGTETRTAADKKQLEELQGMVAKNSQLVRRISEDLLAAIRKQQEDTDKKFTDNANSVVAQVAGEKKLLLVVRKRAVVWSAELIDITDEVLKRLNQ